MKCVICKAHTDDEDMPEHILWHKEMADIAVYVHDFLEAHKEET